MTEELKKRLYKNLSKHELIDLLIETERELELSRYSRPSGWNTMSTYPSYPVEVTTTAK